MNALSLSGIPAGVLCAAHAPASTDTPVTQKSTPAPTPVNTPSTDQKNFTNSIGMEFVLIPAGEFDTGSLSDEYRDYLERTVHRVKIAKPYYMGKYEVTQKQWRDIMGINPSYFKGYDLPVEQVSWYDVQEFIKKLNEKENININKYRLPSEAEWEYASRAGTTTRYSFGDDESKLGEYAWFKNNSGGTINMMMHLQTVVQEKAEILLIGSIGMEAGSTVLNTVYLHRAATSALIAARVTSAFASLGMCSCLKTTLDSGTG